MYFRQISDKVGLQKGRPEIWSDKFSVRPSNLVPSLRPCENGLR